MTGVISAAQILAAIGDGPDWVDEPKPGRTTRPRKTRSDHPPCGTVGGYYVHFRAKEPACAPCKAANAAKKVADRRSRGIEARAPKPIECGTASGYRLHIYRGQATCQACRDAINEVQRAARQARRARIVRLGSRLIGAAA